MYYIGRTIRAADMHLSPADLPQDPIDRSHHMVCSNALDLFDRFIHRSGIRNTVHEKDLVDRETEYIQDIRPDVSERETKALLNAPVEAKTPP